MPILPILSSVPLGLTKSIVLLFEPNLQKSTFPKGFVNFWRTVAILSHQIDDTDSSGTELGSPPPFSTFSGSSQTVLNWKGPGTTKGPSWGYPMLVIGALGSFLEPICGHVLPKVDKLFPKLTFKILPRRALRGPTCSLSLCEQGGRAVLSPIGWGVITYRSHRQIISRRLIKPITPLRGASG